MKSYFNVPDHINNTNRHLGIEKNVRKNNYEPKAKKKHRIAKLRFLNDKRTYEIFLMSLNAMYEHIDLLNQHYFNLKILEEERIHNIELEKQKIKQAAEIQKEHDMQKFQNIVTAMQEQLDMIPKYKAYIEHLVQENKIIEDEKIRINEMIKIENNDTLIKSYQNYFHEIKMKEADNIRLLESLEIQQQQEGIYKSFIVNKKTQYEKYNQIYDKAININNNIINEKLKMQNLLDTWNVNINTYNEYTKTNTEIIQNYKKEEDLFEHQKKITKFKNTFSELNIKVTEIIKNIDNNANIIDDLNNESDQDIPEVNKIHINKTYISHFNSALLNMKVLQQSRIDKINQLKQIEEQQRAMLHEQETKRQQDMKKQIDNYRDFIEISRKHRKKILLHKQLYIKKQEELEKEKEKNRIENESIKLKNNIIKFTKSIELYNTERDNFIKKRKLEIKKKKQQQEQYLLEDKRITEINDKRLRHINYLKTIEQTVQNNYIKQIEKISNDYEKYQEELVRLEQKKEEDILIEQEKTRKLIIKHNKQKECLHNLQIEYNNIIKTNKEEEEKVKYEESLEQERQNNIKTKFNKDIEKLTYINLLREEEELKKQEQELKQQELEEYEKNLAYDNNIKYYTNLLIENKKTHEEFQKSIEEYKEKELQRLAELKKTEEDDYNKEIVNYSINYILNDVDIEIEKIEYDKVIEIFNKQITDFNYNNEIHKKQLAILKIKQKEEEENERLQLEIYEQQMLDYKKQQDKDFILQMENLLIQFNSNTENHIEFIEEQKRLSELADKKKYELEQENIRLLEERQEQELNDSILYYSNQLDKYNDNILEYQNCIIEEKRKIKEAEIQYEINIKKESERVAQMKLDEEKSAFKTFQKTIEIYRKNIDKVKKTRIEKENLMISERQRIEKENISRQNEIHNEYIQYFSQSINNTRQAHNDYIKFQTQTKENFEKQQKIILKNIELEEESRKEELINNYKTKLDLIKEKKHNIVKQKTEQEEALKEYERKQEELLLKQEQAKKDTLNKLIHTFNNELSNIEDNYKNIKLVEEERLKEIERKKKENYKKQEEHSKLEFEKLEEYYKQSIDKFNNTMEECKIQLDQYNDEQLNILKEQQFKLDEDNRLKQEEYRESLKLYKEKINKYNDMVREKKHNIEQIILQKELDRQKIFEENEKEKGRLQEVVIQKYEEEINNFYKNQNQVMEKLYEELKLEKKREHSKRIIQLEIEFKDKMKSLEQDDVVKKIDNTINYIKDLSNNKENTDYINQLKHQYDNTYINPDIEQPIDKKDIMSISENTLTFDHFSIYNRFTFNVVPKIIYQTWPTKNLTKNMGWVVNRLRSTHSDFKYHLFDDNDCRSFIKEHFGMETLWAFDRLIPGAYKADLWRYCAMYITGGIYLDIKMCPVNGFRFDYLLKNDWYCNDIARGKGFAGIWQGILVSRPKNPIYKYLINKVIENVKNEYYGDDPLEITGPKMMKILLNDLKVKVDTPLQIKKYLNKKASTIANREYKVGICIDDIECLLEYDEYRQECLRTGVHYAKAWKNNQVYNKSVLLKNYVSETV